MFKDQRIQYNLIRLDFDSPRYIESTRTAPAIIPRDVTTVPEGVVENLEDLSRCTQQATEANLENATSRRGRRHSEGHGVVLRGEGQHGKGHLRCDRHKAKQNKNGGRKPRLITNCTVLSCAPPSLTTVSHYFVRARMHA